MEKTLYKAVEKEAMHYINSGLVTRVNGKIKCEEGTFKVSLETFYDKTFGYTAEKIGD